MAAVLPWAELIFLASSSAPARFRSAINTRAPEAASPRDICSPKPWAPPVTSATRSLTIVLRSAAVRPGKTVSVLRSTGKLSSIKESSPLSLRRRAASILLSIQKIPRESVPRLSAIQAGCLFTVSFRSVPEGEISNSQAA